MIKFIDLFCGTGGIRLGFEQAMDELNIQYECVKSSEIDKKACETYSQNFYDDPYCDVHEINEIPDFDVLLAGFPCQAFSYAGKQEGFTDKRGTLFFEVERLLKLHKPKLVFLENVRGLLSHDKGRTFKTILKSLVDIGYNVQYRIINSSNYGIPQNRVRLYIFATLGYESIITINSDLGAINSHNFEQKAQKKLFFEDYKHTYVIDILEDNPDLKYNCSDQFVDQLKKFFNGDLNKLHGKRLIDTRNGNSIHSWDIGLKGECSSDEINFMNLLIANRRKSIFGAHQDGKALTINQIKTFYRGNNINEIVNSLLEKGYLSLKNNRYNPVCGNMSFEVFKFLDPKSISITLTASDAHKLGVFHNGRVRRLTPRECARLQGYPDSFILHSKDQYAYKQLGNAVSVPIVKKLFSNFIEHNSEFFDSIINTDPGLDYKV